MRKLFFVSLSLALSCNFSFAARMTLAADEQNLDFNVKKSKADLAYDSDDIKGAIDLYRSLIDSKDTSDLDKVRCKRRLANCLEFNCDYKSAMQTYKDALASCNKLISNDPKNPKLYLLKSLILKNWGNLHHLLKLPSTCENSAFFACNEGLKKCDSDFSIQQELLIQKAQVIMSGLRRGYIISGVSKQAAVDSLIEANRIKKFNLLSVYLTTAYASLGQFEFQRFKKEAQKNCHLAEIEAEKIKDFEVNNADEAFDKSLAYFDLGLLYEKLKNDSQVEKYFELAHQATQSTPKFVRLKFLRRIDAATFINLALYEKRKRNKNFDTLFQNYDRAIKLLNNELAINPKDLNSNRSLAYIYTDEGLIEKKLGNITASKKLFNEALDKIQAYEIALDTKSQLADAIKALIYRKTNQKTEFKKILEKYPTNGKLDLDQRSVYETYSAPQSEFEPQIKTYMRIPGGVLVNDPKTLFKVRYLRIAKFKDKKHFLKYLEKLEKQFEEG